MLLLSKLLTYIFFLKGMIEIQTLRESWQVSTLLQKCMVWLLLPVTWFALAVAEPTNFNLQQFAEYNPVEIPVRDISLIQCPKRNIFPLTH